MFHVTIMGFCTVPYVQRQMDLLFKEFIEFCRAYLFGVLPGRGLGTANSGPGKP